MNNVSESYQKYAGFNNKRSIDRALKYQKEQVDICSIIEKCDIESISEYILKKSRGNKYPDITSLN